ncbi:MAG: gliding motility-associated C-terminal domain-containing protein [Omnitrophica WOR_2 bacterium]
MKAKYLPGFQISIFLIFIIIPVVAYSQGKQANFWYFGRHVGLNFNIGSPPPTVLSDGMIINDQPEFNGTATISDSNGSLLFYSDGRTIWNRSHNVMLNGSEMGWYSTQGAMIVPDPANPDLYYFFNFDWNGSLSPYNFQYSVIDMTLDNGLGGVVANKKAILLVENTTTHLSAVFHENGEDIWVVTHGLNDNTFYSFLISEGGVNINAQTSNAGTICDSQTGYMKISPNGKKIAISEFHSLAYISFFDVMDFHNENGTITDASIVHNPIGGFGLEFSPDNSKLYSNPGDVYFCQYNLDAGSPDEILQSQVQLALENLAPGALQLGPDGKIYCTLDDHFIGIIHNPNFVGLACNFERNAIEVIDGTQVYQGLPSFIQTYLNDPEYSTTQHCFGQPTQFTMGSTNGIDSVYWKFKDFGNMPNDTSSQFNPSYTFSTPGTYYPELTVWSGLLPPKTVKDTVVIYPLPSPDLGNDTLFCPEGAINFTLNVLNGGPGEQYYWNNDFSPGQPPSFLVSDTGYYRVRVKANGCSGNDTIHVGRYPEPLLVNPGLALPAHCGASDGAVTGVAISFGYSYTVSWKDGSDNPVGNALELQNIPSGAYTLQLTFGSSCIRPFGPYIVQDIGGPEIQSAIPTEDHCNQGLGTITITPLIGSVNDYSFSLNGGPFIQNGGLFTGLVPDNYSVMIKDPFDCIGSYPNNPVVVQNIPGPQITNIIPVNETGGNGQGSITIYADGINLSYALNNGTPQPANYFGNLSEGLYTLTVTDEYGCSKDTSVVLQNLQGNYLIAMAEGDTTCLNAAANSGIRVSHVNGVKDLKATLNYDGSRVRCIYFNDSLPGITGIVYPSLSQIVLEWHGNSAITSNDTLTLGELIFETLQSGLADVNWQSTPGTVFTDENGDTIHPDFIPGIIQVHELPQVTLSALPTLCEGDSLNLITTITGGTGPMNVQWNTPQGAYSGSNIRIENSLPEHSGKYSFTVIDRFHCEDTASIDISIIPTPRANFPKVNDTIWYESTYELQAPEGYYSYQWSTGDTTYYIQVTQEGAYSVMIQTEEGCENLESVMMMDGIVPIAVPNAFTPNEDGLNDTFKPVVNIELVKQFSMSIYNQWGQRIFETNSVGNSWSGKDAQPGVYNWVISYSNRIGKMFQMKGVVTIIQ